MSDLNTLDEQFLNENEESNILNNETIPTKLPLQKKKKKVPHIPLWHKYLIITLICAIIVGFLYAKIHADDLQKSTNLAESSGSTSEKDKAEQEHEREVAWDARDVASFCIAALLICIAAGGGIGGGGVLVPSYIFFLQFSPKYAIPLSNCTILGSSISNLILNVNKRHPSADRPCIDWDMMLMMEPLTIAGALVGTFINVISPPWLISVFLVILLTATAVKTLKKGFKKYAEETKALKEQELLQTLELREEEVRKQSGKNGYMALEEDEHLIKQQQLEARKSVLSWNTNDVRKWWKRSLPPGCQQYIHLVDQTELTGDELLTIDEDMLKEFAVKKMLIMKILRQVKHLKASVGIIDEKTNMAGGSITKSTIPKSPYEEDDRMKQVRADGNEPLAKLLDSERYHPPWKVGIMFLTTVVILSLNVIKGNGDNINFFKIKCASVSWWALTLSVFPFVLMICIIARRHLVKIYYQKEEHNYPYLPEDVKWNERNTIRYPLLCSIAGLCAGMFGIGGGIVKGPLMLEMGVLPHVASATSATMILFTSAGASVSYLLFQQLNLNYAIVVFCLGLVFTLIGQKTLNVLVKKYKRNSLIILVIGITVALSAVAMGILSSGALIDLFEGKASGGGGVCAGGGGGGR